MDTITESDFVSTVNHDGQMMTERRVNDMGSDQEGDEEMESWSGVPPASSGARDLARLGEKKRQDKSSTIFSK